MDYARLDDWRAKPALQPGACQKQIYDCLGNVNKCALYTETKICPRQDYLRAVCEVVDTSLTNRHIGASVGTLSHLTRSSFELIGTDLFLAPIPAHPSSRSHLFAGPGFLFSAGRLAVLRGDVSTQDRIGNIHSAVWAVHKMRGSCFL
jgi:hypothetical protein